jgi:hypothetical protein
VGGTGIGIGLRHNSNKAGTPVMAGLDEWEEIARRVLLDPRASRSEVLSAQIGIAQSKDNELKENLETKKQKAWKADINVIKKLSH